MVYYGDEGGMWGGDDPCDRWPMFWEDLAYEPQTADPLKRDRRGDAAGFDGELFDFYRRAIAVRRASDVLRHGAWSAAASDDNQQFFAYARSLGGNQALVGLNRGENDFRWSLPADAPDDLDVALVTDGDGGETPIVGDGEGGGRSIVVPALSGVLLTSP